MMSFPLNQLTCFPTDDVSTISYRLPSIFSPVQAFLMVLLCFHWSVFGVHRCVRGCSGASDRLLSDFYFPPSTLNFTSFAISDGVNQCDSSLSLFLPPSLAWLRDFTLLKKNFVVLRANKRDVAASSSGPTA